MGYYNAGAALGARHLRPTAKLVLVTMAWFSMDEQAQTAVPPCRYWAGWEQLALVLGYDKYGPTAERAVARAVAELVAAGYIVPLHSAATGTRQEYQLRLDQLPDT